MIPVILAALAIIQLPDTALTKAAILKADLDLSAAVASGGPDAFLDALDANAAVLIPGQPILKGKAEASSAFRARYGSPSTLSWNAVHAVVSTDGKLGCTMGYSRFRNARDTAKVERRGMYLTCWTKDTNGNWRVAGTELADSPQAPPALADSATLPGAPHSATVAIGPAPLQAAQDADSVFALLGSQAAGPGPAFGRYAADDAFLLGGDQFPRGPAGIAAVFKDYPAERVITWRPMRRGGLGTGGLAFTVGHSVSGPRPGKTGPANPSKYFTVWRQEPDGRWLYIFDLGTSRPQD